MKHNLVERSIVGFGAGGCVGLAIPCWPNPVILVPMCVAVFFGALLIQDVFSHTPTPPQPEKEDVK